MISGTQVLARMSDNVRQDDLNRHGLLVDRLKQVSAKIDDVQRKICKGKLHLNELHTRLEAERLSLIELMRQGRFVQPTTRSVSRVIKSDLERRQGRVYSQTELAGREGKRFLVDTGMRQSPSREGKPVKKWTDIVNRPDTLEKAKPFDPRPEREAVRVSTYALPYALSEEDQARSEYVQWWLKQPR